MEGEIGTRTEFRDLGSWFTRGARARRGQPGAGRRHRRLQPERHERPRGRPRPHRPRVAQLLPPRLRADEQDGRRPLPEDRGEGRARRASTVRARRGYYAPGRRGQRAKPAEGRDAAIQRALDAPFDLTEVPLRAIADVGPSREAGQGHGAAPRRGRRARASRSPRRAASPATRSSSCCSSPGGHRGVHALRPAARDEPRPETRARYERDGFPIAREMPLAPGPVPGADRGARPQQRPHWAASSTSSTCPPLDGLRVSTIELTDRAARPPATRRRVRRPRPSRRPGAASRRRARCTAASRSTARRWTRRAESPT